MLGWTKPISRAMAMAERVGATDPMSRVLGRALLTLVAAGAGYAGWGMLSIGNWFGATIFGAFAAMAAWHAFTPKRGDRG